MKRIALNIIIAGMLILSASNLYADGNKDRKVKSTKSVVSEKFDVEMKIESWMTELDLFHSGEEGFYEEALQLEGWMMEGFDTASTKGFAEEEQVLEGWMTEVFNAGNEESFEEEEMVLEPWMLKLQE